MELKQLAGMHCLLGCDYLPQYTDAGGGTAICFNLDGITYTVLEDENDGYRSAAGEILVDKDTVKNVFGPIMVLCVWDESRTGDGREILRIFDTVTAKQVIEVGTNNVGDYYPYFVANFDPTAMDQDQLQGEKQ